MGHSLDIKAPGGELDGWRIPSEIQTEKQKREFGEKERGYLSISVSLSLSVCECVEVRD